MSPTSIHVPNYISKLAGVPGPEPRLKTMSGTPRAQLSAQKVWGLQASEPNVAAKNNNDVSLTRVWQL